MKKIFVMLAGLLVAAATMYGQEVKEVKTKDKEVRWIIMARGGSAYNFRTPLVISQTEQPDIRINAKYATKGLKGPPYYEFQIVRWNEKNGWGFKATHHKLYLQNKPPEVQRFTITDGYNLLTITRQWKIAGFIYHLGGGVVITHPESVVRGQHYSQDESFLNFKGYHLSGPVAETAIEKRIDLSKKFLLSFEGRATGSFVKVPVANGHARTSNVALHGLVGIGYKFYGNKK